MDDEQDGMDKVAVDPYPQDLEDLRKSLKKPYNMSVVRRSIEGAPLGRIHGWKRHARRAGYPTFTMGDQFVVFFEPHGTVEQHSGPDVIRNP